MPALFVVFAAVLVSILLWAWLHETQRRAALEAVATEMGLSYAPDDGGLDLGRLDACRLLTLGTRGRARNMMRGRIDDVSVAIFDYQYTTGSGRSASTSRQTVAAFDIGAQDLPTFELRPENLLHKLGQTMGMRDIDFEEFPVFSSKYLLRGDDEARIRQMFRVEVIEHLDTHPGWSIEGGGGWIVFYRAGKRVSAAEIGAFFDDAWDVYLRFGLVREHVA